MSDRTKANTMFRVILAGKASGAVYLESDPQAPRRAAKGGKIRHCSSWAEVAETLRGRTNVYIAPGVHPSRPEGGMLTFNSVGGSITYELFHPFFDVVAVCHPEDSQVSQPSSWLEGEVRRLRDICLSICHDTARLGPGTEYHREAAARRLVLDTVITVIRNEYGRPEPLAAIDSELEFLKDNLIPKDDRRLFVVQRDTITLVREIICIGQERWS